MPAYIPEKAVSKFDRAGMVMVEWEDSARPRSDWEFLANVLTPTIVKCYSVGFIVRESNELIALAPNIGEIEGYPRALQASGIITIPRRAITVISELTEKPK